MKHLLRVLLIFSGFYAAAQQPYGNEWINHAQSYVKFPIVKEGIYRIDSATLAQHFDLSVVDADNFQLFIRGEEQYLYIKGGADKKINKSDYLEFYGFAEISKIDSLIYTDIKYIPNPYGPIFNDTIYGFLTLNNAVNNKRYTLETDTNSAAYPAADHFYTQRPYYNNVSYNQTEPRANLFRDPRYTQAEGRGGYFLTGSHAMSFGQLLNYTTTPLPFYFTIAYSGTSQNIPYTNDHHVTISYTDKNNLPVAISDTLFTGFAAIRQTFSLNTQDIYSASGFTMTAVPNGTLLNYTFYHYGEVFFPQILHLNSLPFYRIYPANNTASKSFYNLTNLSPFVGSEVLLYDVIKGKKIQTVLNGSSVRVVIPSASNGSRLILATDSVLIPVKKLVKVNGTGNFVSHLKPVSRTPYILVYHPNLAASAENYRAYRSSPAGGNYDVFSVNVNELYEQFSYGVNKHPIAISNYVRYLREKLAVTPAYVLLVGKAIKLDDINPNRQYANLVPTMGIPSSDHLLVTDLHGPLTNRQQIAIGRISAINDKQVNDYLQKVQQHESTGPADWKKRVLHFSGGDNYNLGATLAGFMSAYEQTIKDTLFGAQVYTFKKNTTSPVQTNISDSIRTMMNNGAALINIFGHGSATGFDQAIDNPEEQSNVGKYPFIIANSCYSGNQFIEGGGSVSERFVFVPQKGSIGYIASSNVAYDQSLDDFTTHFYKAISATRYGAGIGEIIKEATEKNALHPDPIVSLVGFDMSLHGDPAVKIYNGMQPDYEIKNSDLTFDLKTFTDSVGLLLRVKNYGVARRDSFLVRIERFYPNGDSSVTVKKMNAPFYKDSINLFLFIDFTRGIGLNRFNVSIDYFNEIKESNETNNSTNGTVDLFIPGGDLLPVYPYKYAVIPKQNKIKLRASTTDPFAPLATYKMQLDTCDKFSAPISATVISSTGGVLEWTVDLPFKDSTVYFWRVSRDSVSPEKPTAWRESSFQTIGEKEGWSQAHFNQFKSDRYQFIKYKSLQRQFAFENETHSVLVRNGISGYVNSLAISFYYDLNQLGYWSCAPDGWNIQVFDSITGQPWKVRSLNYPGWGVSKDSTCVCVPRELYVFSFGRVTNCGLKYWKKNLEDFLVKIPKNNYVLAWTVGRQSLLNADIKSYPNSLYSAFESIGAKTIRTVSDTVPYILFGRKGMTAGQGHEEVGENIRSFITLSDTIKTRWKNGFIASGLIGPSLKWNSLHWRVKTLDNGPGDTTVIKMMGVKANGERDTLATFTEATPDVPDLTGYINAEIYPYMELVAYMRDNIYRTSPQMDRWQVLYEVAPELALNPLKGFVSVKDSLQEGDDMKFILPVENISDKAFKDSLVITYWLEDNQRNKVQLPSKLKKAGFAAGEVIMDTVSVNSLQLKGNNSVWIFANPVNHPRYQREQEQFNNIARYGFNVSGDITNPLLDVTFDGVRILNGDIVSAKPNILISLKDENKFLALNDTSAFTVSIQYPDGSAPKRLYFEKDLQFTPAQLPKNSAMIRYAPTFNADGRYQLVVQARDRSNNRSAARDYRVAFEIYTKPGVTDVLNYPNPFSTQTKFVFTLTGSDVPEVFTIQIMTITGKIVREIKRSELGFLHIGRNITEYAWDGRDEYGDRLANGVYLYRVITRLNGEVIEKNASDASKYFVKDFGKMVLMR